VVPITYTATKCRSGGGFGSCFWGLFSVLFFELARAVSGPVASDAFPNLLRVRQYRQTANNRKGRENVGGVSHPSLGGR